MAINIDFIIPDAGLQVNGAVVLSSSLGVNGAVTVANSISVGNTTITGNVNVSVAANVGGALRAGGLVTAAGGIDVTGTANASVGINVGANVNLSTSSVNVGNSSSNAVVTQTTVRVGSVSSYTNVTPTEIRTTGIMAITGATTLSNTLVVTGAANLSSTLGVAGVATFSNNVVITGDLTVSGTTTYVNTATLNIADNIITLNSDVSPATAPTENAGIEVNRGSSANVALRWSEAADVWTVTLDGTNYHRIHHTGTDIALGTETSGNYVATVSSSNGISGSGTGEGSTPSLFAVGANGISVTTAGINVLAGNGIVSNSTGVIARSANGISVDTNGINVLAGNGIVSNTSGVTARSANGISVDSSGINVVAGTELTSNTSGVHHNDIARSNTTSSASPNYGGTFTAVDSVTTNARGHVTAVNTKTVTMPSSNNTLYDLAAVANTAANAGRVRLTDSSSANDDVLFVGQDEITITSNSTAVYIDHNDVARGDSTSSTSPNYSGTFTAIDTVTTNARGHVTGVNTKTVTMPSSNNTTYTTSTVANTVANQGLTRLTSSSNANTDTAVIGLDEITISSNSTAVYVDHNDVARSNTTSSASPNYGGTFTAVDSVTTNARGHVTAVNTKTVTMPSSNNTTYDLIAVANTTASNAILRLTDSGSSNDNVFIVGTGTTTTSSNSTHIVVNSADQFTGTVTSVTGGAGLTGSITTSGSLDVGQGNGMAVDADSIRVVAGSGVASNATGVHVVAGSGVASNSTGVHVVAGTELTSNSSGVHHNDITRSDGTSSASPASGGTFTAIDSVTTNARGHVTAVNLKTVTLPVDPNTTYTGANGVALNGTQFYAAVGASLVSNSTGIHMPAVATAGSSTGGISAITIDAQGRVTSVSGSAGYVTSSGVTSVATGSGLTGGTITSTGTLSVVAGTGIVSNSSGVHVSLTDSVSSTSTTTAATPNSVKVAYDAAIAANTLAASKQTGTVTSVATANGLAGGTITTSGTLYVVAGATLVSNTTGIHMPTVATAGSSTGGISAITIDAQGRVTSVTGSAGYVTSSGVTSVGSGNGLTGGTITSTGTLSVVAGTGIISNTSGVHVNLTDSVSSTSTTTAATPNSVKTAYDLAASKGSGTVTSVTGGNGLTGSVSTSGSLAVGAGNGISVSADEVYLASSVAGSGLTYTNGVLAAAAPTLRHTTSGYTSGGQVFVSSTQPTASNQGDIWMKI